MPPKWGQLTQNDKFFLLTTAIVPVVLWWVLLGRKRYKGKAPLL